MIYLDNAATTFPKPESVIKAVSITMKKYGANPGRSGHRLSLEAATIIYKCREAAADFFGASGPESVMFTLNCTHAINTVLKGLLKPKDHVVLSCLEHNAVTRPLRSLYEHGIDFTQAKVYPCDNDATINSFRKAINAKTALIVCMHASNVWGIKMPVERITALAHQYGIPVLVDAAQTAGILPIDLSDSTIDYICFAGHKGLYGPMGTGMLITEHGDKLKPFMEGGTGTNSISHMQPNTLPDKFESGTQNLPGIAGLKAGIDFVKEQGVTSIARHEYDLISHLYDGLKEIKNVKLYTVKPDPDYFAPLLAFNINGQNSEETARRLDENKIYVRAGLHCAPLAHKFFDTLEQGAVRVCPSIFTKNSDINVFLKTIEAIATGEKSSPVYPH